MVEESHTKTLEMKYVESHLSLDSGVNEYEVREFHGDGEKIVIEATYLDGDNFQELIDQFDIYCIDDLGKEGFKIVLER